MFPRLGPTTSVMRAGLLAVAVVTVAVPPAARAQARPARPRPAPAGSAAPAPFTNALPIEELRNKQAVVETDRGTFVIALLADAAPNHVSYFMKLAREGAYSGTVFHRLLKNGIVQGGDPLSRDPAKRDTYGTGGLGVLKAEPNGEKHTRGAVSAVIVPGKPDSGGAQFFICVSDQPALDGQYTVFGRVVEEIEVVQDISGGAVDAEGRATDRIAIKSVTIRDTPPPTPPPFSEEPVAELARYRAVLETTKGTIRIELMPDRAPAHVRNFLRLAQVGAYDGTAFHRVVPGFVIQTGSMAHRAQPLTAKQQKYVGTLSTEISPLKHEKGIVSMARLDDPNSASTSFFICTAAAPALDGVYTIFGRVVEGLDVVDAIEHVPVDGETPVERVELVRVELQRIAP
ncbi:MAG: peptidylprolyl isomerase [Vicinamibacterales bacterium]